MTKPHEYYMSQALELAREAADAGEVPVGCVIVRDGAVIGLLPRGNGGHGPGQRRAGQLAAGQLRVICDAGAMPHVRRGHSQRPDSQGVLRRTGQCLRRLRRRDQPVYGAVPSPARSGGRNFGRGLSSGTGGIFRETPSGKAVDAKFLRTAERFKTFVTTPAGLLNNSPVS